MHFFSNGYTEQENQEFFVTNVIDFPGKELQIEVHYDNVEQVIRQTDRLESLVEIMDLNVQGLFHVVDSSPEEIMTALLHMSAMWAHRAGYTPEEYYEFRDSMLWETTDGTEGP